jgi:regulator of replication initiation timing
MRTVQKMENNLAECPRELEAMHKRSKVAVANSKLLGFVKLRKRLMEREDVDKFRKLNVFKQVYMKEKHRRSYFELLKMRHVEVYRRNVKN